MVKLGDICKIQSGGTPSRSHLEYWDKGSIPWVKISDFSGKYLSFTEEKITEKGLTNSSAKLFSKGTILYSIFATLGEVCILNIEAATNQAIVGIEIVDKRICPNYLYYCLYSKKNYIKSIGRGVAQNNINLKILREIEIPLVDLEEQHRISNILDDINELINKRKRQLEKLDDLVKSRFVEMFGDPASNPMNWEETTIGKECHYIKDGPHKSFADVGEGNGYPFISVRNIVNGTIDFSTARYISKQDYIDSIKKCHPQKGDMLYSKGGTTGIAKLIDIDIDFANWVHVAVLKFSSSLNGVFFENMLNSNYCYKQSQKLTKGVANRDLVLSAMAQIKLYKPPIDLQNEFATFVEQTDKLKFDVQQSLENLKMLKKALMQKFFG